MRCHGIIAGGRCSRSQTWVLHSTGASAVTVWRHPPTSHHSSAACMQSHKPVHSIPNREFHTFRQAGVLGSAACGFDEEVPTTFGLEQGHCLLQKCRPVAHRCNAIVICV